VSGGPAGALFWTKDGVLRETCRNTPSSVTAFQGQFVVDWLLVWPDGASVVVVDWVVQPPGGPGTVVVVVDWLEPSEPVVVVVDVPGGGGGGGVVVVVVVVVLPSEFTVELVED